MRSFRIGSLFGIPVKLDLTFLVVLPLFAYVIGSNVESTAGIFNDVADAGLAVDALVGGATPWALGLLAAVGLFVGVLAHEFGHSLVAMRYDYDIDSITLWIFGGLAKLTEFPEDWRTEFAIAIAGPVVSVLVGVGCFGLYVVASPASDGVRFVLFYLAVLNVALAGFNMLPAFPMDGGRVLRALLGRNRSFASATSTASEVGKVFAVLLGLLGLVLLDVILIGIAFFVYIAAASEAQQVATRAAFEGVAVRDVMTPVGRLAVVSPDTTVRELLERMLVDRHTGYPVVEGDVPVGVVTRSDASEVPNVEHDAYTVADVMSTDLVTATPEEDAMAALSRMREHDVGRLLVVDGGRLVGLISRSDLVTALDVLREGGALEDLDGPEHQSVGPAT